MNQDPFLWHEAMDRIHILIDTFDRAIENHPVIRADPDLAKLAFVAVESMVTFYTAVVNKAPHMRGP